MNNNRFANKKFKSAAAQSSNGGGRGKVDYTALNTHVSDHVYKAVGCEEGSPEPVKAVISGIVDCGVHQDEEVFKPIEEGSAADIKYRRELVEKKRASIEIVDGVEWYRYQAPATQELAYFVDFPEIIVDKGQFYGDSNPAPYRVLVGGKFKGIPKTYKVSGYMNNNTWMFGDSSYHTKLAKAAGINIKEGFPQEDVLNLIGSGIYMDLETYLTDDGYLREKVTNPSKLRRGEELPEYDYDNLLFYIGMNEDNTPSDIEMLRGDLENYIKEASNYEGSKLQKQLEARDALKGDKGGSDKGTIKPTESISKNTSSVNSSKVAESVDSGSDEDWDDTEVPF